MFKQSIWLFVLSVVAIYFKFYLVKGLGYLTLLHHEVTRWLAYVFATGPTGRLVQSALALILIPVALGVLINLVYWLVKRKSMPQTFQTVWIVWTVLLVNLLARAGC